MTWQLAQASGSVVKYENAWPWTSVTVARPSARASDPTAASGQLQRPRGGAATGVRASVPDE